MRRSQVAHVLAVLFLLVASAGAIDTVPETYWQLVFQYNAQGLTILQTTPIPLSGKEIATPGLKSAPVRLPFEAVWQDGSGGELASSAIEIPLGFRSAPADDGPCEMLVPEEGIVVIRIPGPPRDATPTSLVLTTVGSAARKRADLPVPAVFSFQTITLPLQVTVPRLPMDGPLSSVKLRDTGPDNNRLVIVVLSDGYTSANLAAGMFTTHTNTLLSAFTATQPWDVIFNGTNVYRIDVESNQQGADHDPFGTFVDTYFNSSFWVNNIERLLAVDNTGYYRAIAAADAFVGPGLWDQLVIQVNSTKYGGSGGAVSVVSAHSAGPQVVLHELGHTFADLADEYTTAYPGFPPGDGEANVDYDYSGPGLKWLVWVTPGTPLPTPDISAYYSAIGAFEGARYLTTGIYRPSHNCLMRSLGVPLDAVCKEAHLRSFFDGTSLVDATAPSTSVTSLVAPAGIGFSVTPVPFTGLVYEWYLNDVLQSANGSSITITYENLFDAGIETNNSLRLRMTYPTTKMRLSVETEDFTWMLEPDCNSNGVADKIDISSGTSPDINANGIPDGCEEIVCCEGTTGNVNMTGIIDGGDLALLVAYLANVPAEKPVLSCLDEANINAVGIVDGGDLALLVAYLTNMPGEKPPLPSCP